MNKANTATLAAIKKRVADYDAPVVLPDGYDPRCTCGSAVPVCPKCEEAANIWHERRHKFQKTAYFDIKALLEMVEEK